MGTILNGKYLSMPEQVQKNKVDIQIIQEFLQNIYKCSTALEESSTSINIEYTNIGDKRDFLFAFLLDNKGLLFKIINIIGDIVYLEFYSKLPSVDFNYLGEWVAGNNEYHPNDVVLYNGSLYICENVVLDSSVAPPQDTTNWSLFLGFGDDIGNFITNLYNNRDNIVYKPSLKGTTLFSGSAYESLTLTDNYENYDYLEFDIKKTGWNQETIIVPGGNYSRVSLMTGSTFNASGEQVHGAYIETKTYLIDGKNLTYNGSTRTKILINGTITTDNLNETTVTEVRGYRRV